MKRSEVNGYLKWAEALLKEYKFPLPRFAHWSPAEWTANRQKAAEIFETNLGWDITDFGSGDFEKIGAVLFTIRNGVHDKPGVGSPYAEKLILLKDGQYLPCHYHAVKTEDIINRGGARIFMKLYNARPDGSVDTESADHPDNYCAEKRPRVPASEEDCERLYPLVGDYGTL